MATKSLAHGMGTFFKDCEHPQSRWSKCPHEYTIRYRSAAGKQTEEAGFSTQDKAIDRLTTVYQEKKAAPRNQGKAERIQKYGAMQFREYTAEWKAGQRDLAESSLRTLESLLENHILPTLGSRRMSTFDPPQGRRRLHPHNGTQRRWPRHPVQRLRQGEVGPPRRVPPRHLHGEPRPAREAPAVRPRACGHPLPRPAPRHTHCWRRPIPAHRRPHERLRHAQRGSLRRQHQQPRRQRRLPHHRAGQPDHEDLRPPQAPQAHRLPRRPLPARIRETIEWYADKHGTVDGHPLRHPMDPTRPFLAYYLENQWQRIKRAGEVDAPTAW
ncbi:site-specific integrase [Streptomyces sp. NPDC058304]|uniref:site-specific integrase n=1 Tax=Streptomyces sp. NPDC058304 TaxID=3346437 RepID=UPI0036EB8F8A